METVETDGEQLARETIEMANTDSLELQQLKKEKAHLLNNTKDDDEVKQLKRDIFLMKNPVFRTIGKISSAIFTGAANLGDAVLKAMINFLRPRPPAKNPPAPEPLQPAAKTTSASVGRKVKKKNKLNRKRSTVARAAPARPGSVPAAPKPKPKSMDEKISDVMANIEKEMGKVDKY